VTAPRGRRRYSAAPGGGTSAGLDPANPGPLKKSWNFFTRPDPPWWIPHVFAALVIAIAVVVATMIVDSQRTERDSDHQAALQNQAQVLENLRFVRAYADAQGEVAASEGVGSMAGSGVCPPPHGPSTSRQQPFESINLSGQNLAFLQLPNSNFARASFDGGRLVGIVLAPDSDLAGASLVEASIVDGNLSGASLVNSDFTNADLFGAKLCAANLAGAKLQGANLSNAKLTDIDFRNASGTWVPQIGAPDVGSMVHGKVNLSGADLAGADLTGATNIADAMLYNIYYDEVTKWPAGFQPPPSRAKRCFRADGFSDSDNPCLEGEDDAR
jgi:uncharacterized protein YjbI with pentapeptide repeats